MKRLVMILLALVAIGGATEINAQSWLEQLGQRAKERAKENIERKVEQKTDDLIDGIFNKAEDATKGKGRKKRGAGEDTPAETQPAAVQQATTPERDGVINNASVAQSGQQKGKTAEMSWNRYDFVAGDEVFFEDLLTNEQQGEFPSQWDLLGGSAEIVKVNGENAILLTNDDTRISPYMENGKSYLPEIFTIEFDYYSFGQIGDDEGDKTSNIYVRLHKPDANEEYVYFEIPCHDTGGDFRSNCDARSGSDSNLDLDWSIQSVPDEGWHHVAISFNKRALKIYLDQTRVVNAPNVKQAGWISLQSYRSASGRDMLCYIKNIRIAKGAVPLYDRMMSDGKFITYGITFDVGKATIKPESMGEINRIVQLMNENPTLKFSVEGHTDSTGNAASNQTLSEQRAQAIVDKLVELGIAKDRLTAVGKGQNNPIADNSTDEGRAKNRRVEFVKM